MSLLKYIPVIYSFSVDKLVFVIEGDVFNSLIWKQKNKHVFA